MLMALVAQAQGIVITKNKRQVTIPENTLVKVRIDNAISIQGRINTANDTVIILTERGQRYPFHIAQVSSLRVVKRRIPVLPILGFVQGAVLYGLPRTIPNRSARLWTVGGIFVGSLAINRLLLPKDYGTKYGWSYSVVPRQSPYGQVPRRE
jgi:hypothetical protein